MRVQIGELFEPMVRAAQIVEGHLNGILSHWTRGLTTAFMGGLNSLLSAVKRKARLQLTVENITPCSTSSPGNSPYRATDPLKVARNRKIPLHEPTKGAEKTIFKIK